MANRDAPLIRNGIEGQEILCKIAKQTPDFSPARQVENFTCKSNLYKFIPADSINAVIDYG